MLIPHDVICARVGLGAEAFEFLWGTTGSCVLHQKQLRINKIGLYS